MRRFGTHIHGGMMALGHYVMIDFECTFVLYDGVICDGIEVHGKHLV